MTEDRWNDCTDPIPMLEWLRRSEKATERRLRLFACACCREVWHLLDVRQCRKLISVAERYADGQANEKALEKASRDAHYASSKERISEMWAAPYACQLAANTPIEVNAVRQVVFLVEQAIDSEERESEPPALHELLRCVFPNPLRPLPPLEPSWLTPLVVGIAQRAYDERDYASLPVLADALEESGCTDAVLLGHLRGAGPHVRGCFAVDAVLGKS